MSYSHLSLSLSDLFLIKQLLCFILEGKPTLGCVYHAQADVMYVALSGSGKSYRKTKDGTVVEQIHVRDPVKSLSDAAVIMSNSKRERVMNILEEAKIVKRKQLGSMGLKCCAIAAAQDADFYLNLEKRSSYWDSVAPWVILQEAGSAIPIMNVDTWKPVEYSGSSTRHKYEMIIAANVEIYEKLKPFFYPMK